jgi:hypothetical protein
MAPVSAAKPLNTRIPGWILLLSFLAMVAALMIAACGDPGSDSASPPSRSGEGQVATLASAAELETYLKDQYARSINVDLLAQSGPPETDGGRSNGDAAEDSAGDAAPDGAPDGGDYTTTNVQEAGVDEADVVKSDGRHLYIANGTGFQVVAIAEDLTVMAAERVGGPVDALYLYGDKLVVLYGAFPGGFEPGPIIDLLAGARLFGMPYWIPAQVKQGVAIYDIADPAVPIHNNLAEQEMKRIALLRKNALFVATPNGGDTTAILSSLTSTCRRHGVNPQVYLTQLLANLPDTPVNDIDQWLPDEWKKRLASRPSQSSSHQT